MTSALLPPYDAPEKLKLSLEASRVSNLTKKYTLVLTGLLTRFLVLSQGWFGSHSIESPCRSPNMLITV
jgi:hypothetical protein